MYVLPRSLAFVNPSWVILDHLGINEYEFHDAGGVSFGVRRSIGDEDPCPGYLSDGLRGHPLLVGLTMASLGRFVAFDAR